MAVLLNKVVALADCIVNCRYWKKKDLLYIVHCSQSTADLRTFKHATCHAHAYANGFTGHSYTQNLQ